MTTFGTLLWDSFVRINGVLVSVAGIAITILAWSLPPNIEIPIWVFVLTVGVIVIPSIAFFDAARIAHASRIPALPSVLMSRQVQNTSGTSLVCLLSPSQTFSYGMQCSIYLSTAEGFEVLVSLGKVVNIQDDGKIQVQMSEPLIGQEESVDQIRSNTKDTIDRLIVKPAVPHDISRDAVEASRYIADHNYSSDLLKKKPMKEQATKEVTK